MSAYTSCSPDEKYSLISILYHVELSVLKDGRQVYSNEYDFTKDDFITWHSIFGLKFTGYRIDINEYFSSGEHDVYADMVLKSDNDADTDGICGDVDNCPAVSNADQANIDGDALGDACDPDSDNDGIPDVDDSEPLNKFICQDSDGDSCDDCALAGFVDIANDGPDNDSDGTCDVGDADDDNDGVLDVNDTNDFDPFTCQDSDNDTCDDCTVGSDGLGPLPDNDTANDGLDTDTDGLCNAGDPDDDNDGVLDSADSNPTDRFVCADSDADSCDDCSVEGFTNTANDGLDTDSDGLCNVGDTDDDNDGIADDIDPEPLDDTNADFDDGTTTGEVTSGDLGVLTITNVVSSGVSIVSTGAASVSACGGSVAATFSSGDAAVVTCGSVTIEVVSGSIFIEFVTGGVPATTTLTAGESLTFDPDTLLITSVDTSATITIGGAVLEIGPGETLQIDIIPPVFDPILDITLDATSVDGVIANYPIPTATDNIDPNPDVSCIPVSGSLFPIGVNTVQCVATDLVGNSADGEFTITVQVTFESLEDTVNSFDLKKGITTSLIKKIEASSASFDRDNIKAATNQLDAFINEVNAQEGKALTGDQAEVLRGFAELLITHISSL